MGSIDRRAAATWAGEETPTGMLFVLGLVVLVPASVRLAFFGRRRALPVAALAWVPLTAPLAWVLGCVLMAMKVRSAATDVRPLSEVIADALGYVLDGASASVAVLGVSWAFFALRPTRADEAADDLRR